VRNALLFSFASAFTLSVNMVFAVIIAIVLGIYFIYNITVVDRARIWEKTKFSLLIVLFTAMWSAWWFLPALSYMVTARDIISYNILAETPLMYNAYSSYPEVFRLLSHWAFHSGYEKMYYNYSSAYLYNPYIILISFVIPIIAILGLLFRPVGRSEKTYISLFASFLLILAIPMAVGAYPPQSPEGTATIYQWLYDHIFWFKIFRNGYKFAMILAFVYAVLLGFLLDDMARGFRRHINIGSHNKMSMVFVCLILLNSYPFFTGSLFEKEFIIDEVPVYWTKLAEWVNAQPDDFKVLLLPDQYFPVYVWGHPMSDVAASFINRPQIFLMPGLPIGRYGYELINSIYREMNTNSSVSLGSVLWLMGVKYIIQRNDVDWEYYGSLSPRQVKDCLGRQKDIRLVKSFGPLDIYENSLFLPTTYAATNVVEAHGEPWALGVLSTNEMSKSIVILTPKSEGKPNYLPAARSTRASDYSLPWGGIFPNASKVFFTAPKAGFYEVHLELPILLLCEESGFKVNLRQTYVDAPNNIVLELTYSAENETKMSIIDLGNVPRYDEKSVFVPFADLKVQGWRLEREATLKVRLWNRNSLLGCSNLVTVNSSSLPVQVAVDGKTYPVEVFDAKSRRLIAEVYLPTGDHLIDIDGIDGQSLNLVYVKRIDLDITSVKTKYVNISPVTRVVHVNSSTPFILVFSESFDTGWKLYPGQVDWTAGLVSKPLSEDHHMIANGFANAWYIEKPGDHTFTILYHPQVLLNIGVLIAIIFLSCTILYFLRIEFIGKLASLGSI